MKKMLKLSAALLFSLSLTVFFTTVPNVYAADTNEIPFKGTYDLTCQKEQTFVLQDKNGEIVYITISPIDNYTRVANGSYRVKYQHANYWKGSFIVNINGNRITSVNSPSVTPITGSVVKSLLEHKSSTLATLHVYWHPSVNYVVELSGMKAYISGTDLKVSSL